MTKMGNIAGNPVDLLCAEPGSVHRNSQERDQSVDPGRGDAGAAGRTQALQKYIYYCSALIDQV